MKKVLVTGGSGFIGRHALQRLLEKGYEVHAVTSKKQEPCKDIRWHSVDLMDFPATESVIQQIQPAQLLHFAWTVIPGQFWTSADNVSWVAASYHLMKAFVANGGERIVCAGSCAEYDWNQELFDEKESRFLPATVYGASKRSLFLMMESFAKTVGVSFAWGYIFHVYGSYEHPDRFVPYIIRGLLQNKKVVCSQPEQIRDFLHTADVADAFVQLIDSRMIGGVNIGSGCGLSLEKMAQMIADQMGCRHLLEIEESRERRPLRLVPSTKRLNKEIGWVPLKNTAQRIEEVIKWWQNSL